MKETIIRDPIHGYIDLSHYPFIKKIIETPYFQRLRRLSQLGVSVYVYPSAVHNRFNHSLGAMQLFTRVYDHLFRDVREFDKEKFDKLRKIGVATVLLHDIGHGPFSHVSESMFGFKHESLSQRIISEEMKNILKDDGISHDDVRTVIDTTKRSQIGELRILSQLVDSAIDVDRLDYLARDIYFTGVGFGIIDLDRIIHTMTIHREIGTFLDERMVIEEKGKRSIETLLLTRDVMYSDVYYHKATRGIEGLLRSLFKRVKNISEEGKMELPSELQFLNDDRKFSFSDLFDLDDNFIYSLLLKWSKDAKDKIVSDLSRRIVNRDLFKAIEYPIGGNIIKIAKSEDEIKKMLQKNEIDPEYYYFIDEPEDRPYSPVLSITNPEEQQKALEKNIFIRLENSKCNEISQESRIIKTLTERQYFTRLYVPAELRESARKILQNQ